MHGTERRLLSDGRSTQRRAHLRRSAPYSNAWHDTSALPSLVSRVSVSGTISSKKKKRHSQLRRVRWRVVTVYPTTIP